MAQRGVHWPRSLLVPSLGQTDIRISSTSRCYDAAMDARRTLEHFLEQRPEVRFAYLFGSRASGRNRAESDWDVAVYLDEGLGERARFDWLRQAHAELSAIDLDLVILNDAAALVAHRALSGRRLSVRDKVAHVRFFVRTQARYGDEAYYRDLHRQARERRLREGTFGRS